MGTCTNLERFHKGEIGDLMGQSQAQQRLRGEVEIVRYFV